MHVLGVLCCLYYLLRVNMHAVHVLCSGIFSTLYLIAFLFTSPHPISHTPPCPTQMINIQANDNFASHQLNRDTWSDAAVVEIVKNNFVFVQIMAESAFGQSVCGAYRVVETPIIMVVDPETRAKVKQWTGFLAPDRCVCRVCVWGGNVYLVG